MTRTATSRTAATSASGRSSTSPRRRHAGTTGTTTSPPPRLPPAPPAELVLKDHVAFVLAHEGHRGPLLRHSAYLSVGCQRQRLALPPPPRGLARQRVAGGFAALGEVLEERLVAIEVALLDDVIRVGVEVDQPVVARDPVSLLDPAVDPGLAQDLEHGVVLHH